MTLKHVMFDLETFSTSKDAAIVSIGAVLFDPNQGVLGKPDHEEQFYRVIDVTKTPQRLLGSIHGATVAWWLQQCEAAREALTTTSGIRRVTLDIALGELSMWLESNGCKGGDRYDWRYWANDPDFDLAILQSAYERHEMPLPFVYKGARSMRTMCDIARQFKLLKPDGSSDKRSANTLKHNALFDAVYQAEVIIEIQQALRKRMG